MQFGNVQRGFLGIEVQELNGMSAKELNVGTAEGVYIKKVTKLSGAEMAGLQKGDVIFKLDNQKISTNSELMGYIGTKRPNDKIQVSYIRDAKSYVATVILSKNDMVTTEFKGLELENLLDDDKKKFKITEGVKIKDLNNDRLNEYANDLKGGIILKIGNAKATNIETVSKLLSNFDDKQSVQIEMITKSGELVRLIL